MDPGPQSHIWVALRDCARGRVPSVLGFYWGQTVTDGSNPSMKKETHCIFIDTGFGIRNMKVPLSRTPQGRALGHPAPRPAASVFPLPEASPQRWAGDPSQLFIPRPSPVSFRGSDPGRSPREKVAGPSQLPRAQSSRQSPETSPFDPMFSGQLANRDIQRGEGRMGRGISLCFSPLLMIRTGGVGEGWLFFLSQ